MNYALVEIPPIVMPSAGWWVLLIAIVVVALLFCLYRLRRGFFGTALAWLTAAILFWVVFTQHYPGLLRYEKPVENAVNTALAPHNFVVSNVVTATADGEMEAKAKEIAHKPWSKRNTREQEVSYAILGHTTTGCLIVVGLWDYDTADSPFHRKGWQFAAGTAEPYTKDEKGCPKGWDNLFK